MDVVLQVPELGVVRAGVAAEAHPIDQPELAQLVDDRDEVVEVALQALELAPLGRGQTLASAFARSRSRVSQPLDCGFRSR